MKIQSYSKFRDVTKIKPERITAIVPSFTLSVPTWAGASTLLAQFPVLNTNYYFSLKLPVLAFGENFIGAIRWKASDVCYRFKLWDNTKGLLYYPIYAGERVGLNAIIEIWSINSASAPALDANHTLYMSKLVFPNDTTTCCESPSDSITLVKTAASTLNPYANCNPFCNNLCD